MSEVPNQFTEDVKIEQSARGARVTVHVFGNNGIRTMYEAIELYKQTIANLQKEGIAVAPIEIKEARA